MSETKINLFKEASKKALLFPSKQHANGLTVDQLWQLPLQSMNPSKASLEQIAQDIDNELAKAPRRSFVTPSVDAALNDNKLRLAILEEIIADRLAERDAVAEAAKKKERIKVLYDLLNRKEIESLESKSADDIRAEIAALS